MKLNKKLLLKSIKKERKFDANYIKLTFYFFRKIQKKKLKNLKSARLSLANK